MTLAEFFAVYVKFFFILTPIFVIAVFLAMTEYESDAVRRALAVRSTIGMVIIIAIMKPLFIKPNNLPTLLGSNKLRQQRQLYQ